MTTKKIIIIGSVSILAIAIGYYFYSKKADQGQNQTDPITGKPNTSNGITAIKPGTSANPNNLSQPELAQLVQQVTSGRGR